MQVFSDVCCIDIFSYCFWVVDEVEIILFFAQDVVNKAWIF